jgi:hypothetical protein
MKLIDSFNGGATLINSTPLEYFKMTDCTKRVPSTDEYLDSSKDEDIFNKFLVKIPVSKNKFEYCMAYYNGTEWKSLNGMPLYDVLSWAPAPSINKDCKIDDIM